MDLINDFYLPATKSDNIKNSTAYKLAKANGIENVYSTSSEDFFDKIKEEL